MRIFALSPAGIVVCLSLLTVAIIGSSGCNVAATGRNLQGRRMFEQGQFAQAITRFQQALDANPRNADAYYNLGATYHQVGKQQNNVQYSNSAEQLYRQAIALDNLHVEAHRGLAVLLAESGRPAHAFDLIRTWQARYPTWSEPLIELARLHQEFGDRGRAVEFLADALSLDSKNYRALNAMGQIREEMGQYHLALDNYIRSYQSNNMQYQLQTKIASLQGQIQYPNAVQPGQPRYGATGQYVPR